VHLLQSRTDEAIVWLEKARSAMPALPNVHSRLAAAHALKGETERAAAELVEARRLAGEGSFSSLARLKAAQPWGGAENPRLVRSHLIRRAAQGRDAGGMTADGSSVAA
jgi:predicted Zn-dependent protease